MERDDIFGGFTFERTFASSRSLHIGSRRGGGTGDYEGVELSSSRHTLCLAQGGFEDEDEFALPRRSASHNQLIFGGPLRSGLQGRLVMNPIFVEDQQSPPIKTISVHSSAALSPSESSSTLPEDQSLNFTTEDDDDNSDNDNSTSHNTAVNDKRAIGDSKREQSLGGQLPTIAKKATDSSQRERQLAAIGKKAFSSSPRESAIERRPPSPNAPEEGAGGGTDSLPRFMTVFTVSRGDNIYANPAMTSQSDQQSVVSSTARATIEDTGGKGRVDSHSNGGIGVGVKTSGARRLARGHGSSSFARSSSSTNTSIELHGKKVSSQTPSRSSQTSKSDSANTEPSTIETDLSLLPSGDSDKVSDTSDSEKRHKREVSFKTGTLDNEGNTTKIPKQKHYKKQVPTPKTSQHVQSKTKSGHHHHHHNNNNNHSKVRSRDSTSTSLDIEELDSLSETEDQSKVPQRHQHRGTVDGGNTGVGRGPPGKTKAISDSIEIQDETREHLSRSKERPHSRTHQKDQRPNMSDSPKGKHHGGDKKHDRTRKERKHREKKKLANENYEIMIKGVVKRTRRKRMCQMFVILAVSLSLLGITAFLAIFFSLQGKRSESSLTITTAKPQYKS